MPVSRSSGLRHYVACLIVLAMKLSIATWWPGSMIHLSRSRIILAILSVAALLILPMSGEQEGNQGAPAKAQPGFLEIARDPNATAEQKRTIAAMMDFVKETDPAAAFEKLKASDVLTLYGGGADGLSDLTPISQFTGLETLVLFNHHISDLTPLETLRNLRTLRLEVNRIHDISPLAKLRNLESLQINDNLIADLRPLSGLSRLRTLWISRNQVSDISPLKGLKELRDLHLIGNKVTDLTIFADLALCDLRLGSNGITDISDLRTMNQNTTCFIALDLSDNAIRDVEPIGKLARISSMNLANNRIPDIDELRNPALKYLDLDGNQLARVPDLRTLDLSAIRLRRNPIEDYSDLVAYKEEKPMVEILADEGFARAFEASIPVKKELEGSPLLGTWRTDRLESEWGPLVLELRFLPNGVYYQVMLSAEEDATDEEEGFSIDGRFAVRGDRLEMTIQKHTTEPRFVIENRVLTLDNDGEKMRYRKVTE